MMANSADQDLADKALAEEFGAYISAVASKIVVPITVSATNAQSSIGESANKAQLTIAASLKRSEDSFQSLLQTLRAIGVDLQSTVASVYEGHETTRGALLELLQGHRDAAKGEAAEQVRLLGQNIQSDLKPRLESLIKPVADIAAKASLRQMDFAKQIGEKMIREFRDTSEGTAQTLNDVGQSVSQFSKLIASLNDQAVSRHRQLMLVVVVGVVVQIAFALFVAMRIWH